MNTLQKAFNKHVLRHHAKEAGIDEKRTDEITKDVPDMYDMENEPIASSNKLNKIWAEIADHFNRSHPDDPMPYGIFTPKLAHNMMKVQIPTYFINKSLRKMGVSIKKDEGSYFFDLLHGGRDIHEALGNMYLTDFTKMVKYQVKSGEITPSEAIVRFLMTAANAEYNTNLKLFSVLSRVFVSLLGIRPMTGESLKGGNPMIDPDQGLAQILINTLNQFSPISASPFISLLYMADPRILNVSPDTYRLQFFSSAMQILGLKVNTSNEGRLTSTLRKGEDDFARLISRIVNRPNVTRETFLNSLNYISGNRAVIPKEKMKEAEKNAAFIVNQRQKYRNTLTSAYLEYLGNIGSEILSTKKKKVNRLEAARQLADIELARNGIDTDAKFAVKLYNIKSKKATQRTITDILFPQTRTSLLLLQSLNPILKRFTKEEDVKRYMAIVKKFGGQEGVAEHTAKEMLKDVPPEKRLDFVLQFLDKVEKNIKRLGREKTWKTIDKDNPLKAVDDYFLKEGDKRGIGKMLYPKKKKGK